MIYNSNNSGHADSYQVGVEFQDFVCAELAKHHIILQNLQSLKYQYNTGENLQGWEIKYDSRCTGDNGTKATNRLSIEVFEKTDPNNPEWIPSGIYRDDNSWLYIQGNYMGFWLFDIKILRQLYLSGIYQRRTLPTIVTFYLPIEVANEKCIRYFKTINDGEKKKDFIDQ